MFSSQIPGLPGSVDTAKFPDVYSQLTRVQTDRQTERQTDGKAIPIAQSTK